jgi:hypothetical protein
VLIAHQQRRDLDGWIFIGFSIEQLQTLQAAPMHPLQFLTLVPASRLCFLQRGPGNGPPIAGEQPMHANFVTLLPSRRSASVAADQVQRFRALAQRLDKLPGALVRPV